MVEPKIACHIKLLCPLLDKMLAIAFVPGSKQAMQGKIYEKIQYIFGGEVTMFKKVDDVKIKIETFGPGQVIALK